MRLLEIFETDNKGNKTARDFYGRVVGTYDKASDITRDFYGRIVSYGDTLSSLVVSSK